MIIVVVKTVMEMTMSDQFVYIPPTQSEPIAQNVEMGYVFLTRTQWWHRRPKNFSLILDPKERHYWKRKRRCRSKRFGKMDAFITNKKWFINLRLTRERKICGHKMKKVLNR